MSEWNDYADKHSEEIAERVDDICNKTIFPTMLVELKTGDFAWFEYRKNTDMYFNYRDNCHWAKDEIIELYRNKIAYEKVKAEILEEIFLDG